MRAKILAISILILLSLGVFAQVSLYSENFESYSNGTNTSELWTLDSSGLTIGNRYDVNSDRIHAEGTGGEVVWTSTLFSIAGYANVPIAVDVEEGSGMEADDYVHVYYKLNGGAETLLSVNGTNVGDFGQVVARDTVSGETVQIVVRINNDSGEKHYINSVNVEGNDILYFDDFSSYGDGQTSSSEWTAFDLAQSPKKWETKSEEFWAEETVGEVMWQSRNIDIAGFDSVKASLDVREVGTLENGDYFRVYYTLDGGPETLFDVNGDVSNDFTNMVSSTSGIAGDSMRIIIRLKCGANEEYWFDNVLVEIDFPKNPMVLTMSSTQVICTNDSNGTATVGFTGGRAPLTISWSNGESAPTIDSLDGGTYTVTVTDYEGTTATSSTVVYEPAVLTANIAVSNGTDLENPDASLDLTVTGGNPPYTYEWSNGQISQDINGLSGGEHLVQVTDSLGCSVSQTAFTAINDTVESGAFIIDMGQSPQTFNNSMKPYGLVYTLVKDYQTPILWSINPEKSHEGTDFTYNSTDYKAGPFIIQEQYRSATIDSVINAWVADSGVVGVTTTGDIIVPIYSEIKGFSNLILDEDNADKVSPYLMNAGIPSDIYYVGLPSDLGECDDFYAMPHADPTWADHNFLLDFNTNYNGFIWTGCHAVSMLEGIENPSDPTEKMNFLTTDGLQCYSGGKCGDVTETHSGATTPYAYNTSFGAHPVMQFLGDMTPSTENGSEQWYIPVTYGAWNSTTYRAVTTADGAYPRKGVKLAFGRGFGDGSHGVVLYEGGHTAHDKGSEANQVAAQRIFLNQFFMASIEKNFNASHTITTRYGIGQAGSVKINNVIGGKPPYTYSWTSTAPGTFADATADSTSFTPSAAATGENYTLSVVVEDACGRRYFKTKAITIFHIDATNTNVLCKDDANGTATVSTITNGESPYTYNWSTTATSQSINSLIPGDYEVTVTENTGLIAYDTVTITEPTVLTNSVTPTNASCQTAVDGQALATPVGGTSPYNYSWSSGGSSATETGLAYGATPTVTVTDNNGCSVSTTSATIDADYILIASASASNISELGVSDGGIDVTVSNGQSPYTYSWCSGQTSEDLSNVDPGSYTVTITDNAGCTTTATDLIGKSGAVIFIGENDSNWNDASNWQENSIPDANMDVIIVSDCGIPATTVNVNGTTKDVYIYPGGVLNFGNKTVLDVKGDFTNNGTFNAGNSRTTFTGTVQQNIAGISHTEFHEMYVNNTSSTGVNLLRTIEINDELQLIDGNIYTNIDTIRVTNNDSAALRIFSENSYVVGYLMRRIKSTAFLNPYYYPLGLGDPNQYHLASIRTMSMTGTDNITGTFTSLDRYSREQFVNVQDDELSYAKMNQTGMWILEPDIQPTGGYYDLDLSIENFPGLIDNLYGIVKRPKGADAGSWNANFGSIASFNGEGRRVYQGKATKKFNLSFSEFGVGEGEFGLPIELLYFDAGVKGETVELNWSTATEINNESFTIEKSDGVNFEELVTIPGAVNSSEVLTYSYVDKNPFNGQSYYRLKQTDLDGQFSYSEIRPVYFTRDATKTVMKVYPNPSSGNIYIHLQSANDQIEISVMDISGRVIFNQPFDTSTGRTLHNVNLRSEITAGTYIIVVKDGEKEYTEKVVIR